VLYGLSIRGQRDQFLLSFWHDYFPDYAHPLSALLWLPRRLWEMYCYLQMQSGGLLLILAIAGAFWLYRSSRRALMLSLVGPLALAILAAAVLQYPFGAKRVSLFLAPFALLLSAAGLDLLRRGVAMPWRRLWWVPALLAVATEVYPQGVMLIHPKQQSYIRPAVEYLRAHRQAGEPIYVVGRYTTTFRVYWGACDGQIHLNYDLHVPIDAPRFWAIQGYDNGEGPGEPVLSESVVDSSSSLRTPGSFVALYRTPEDSPATPSR
jgi:hypothetical protein